jgi:hypothetical protein
MRLRLDCDLDEDQVFSIKKGASAIGYVPSRQTKARLARSLPVGIRVGNPIPGDLGKEAAGKRSRPRDTEEMPAAKGRHLKGELR